MIRFCVLIAAFLITACVSNSKEEPLYTYNGEEVFRQSLSPDLRLKLYKLEKETYDTRLEMIRDSIVDRRIKELALKQGKSEDTVREFYFSSKPISTDERKLFFKEHSHEISEEDADFYPDLDREIIKERHIKAKRQLLREVEVEAGINLFGSKPVPPETQGVSQHLVAQLGPDSAPIEIIEFADFSCPHCANVAAGVRALKQKYGDKIKLSFRHFLLSPSGYSQDLAIAGECAAKQNKFWEFYDYVFANQGKVVGSDADTIASQLPLDKPAFKSCLNNRAIRNAVTIKHQHASMLGIKATPTFYVNNRQVAVGENIRDLEYAIEQAIR